MGAELHERLLEIDVAEVLEHHGDEARVHQVQHRVLVAADVAVHGQPAGGERVVHGRVVPVRGRVTQEVPRRVEERIGDVRLAACGAIAAGAGGLVPAGHPGERAHAGVVGLEVVDPGQLHGELLLGHRHRAAVLAVHDGDGRAPVALPGDAPVPQAVVDLELAEAALAQPGRDRALAFGHAEAVELAGVHQHAVAGVGLGEWRVGPVAVPGHHADDVDAHGGGELEIPFVPAGYRHDRAGAVLHEHVVGDPHGDGLAGGRVAAVAAGEHAGLFLVGFLPAHQIGFRRLGLVVGHYRQLRVRRD